MTTHRHHLVCSRAGCGRQFTATRSDAMYCSRRCRRDKESPKQRWTLEERNRHAILYSRDPALAAREYNKARHAPDAGPPAAPSVLSEADRDAGWRVMGGFLVPPREKRWCATFYPPE